MKYVKIIAVLLFLALIFSCINKCNSASAVSEYQKGNKSAALEKFEKADTDYMSATELYYYATLCSDENKARNLKIKTYNKIVNDEEKKEEFKTQFGSTIYDEIIELGEQTYIEQRAERHKSVAVDAAEISIQKIAHNPSSVRILQSSIVGTKIVNDKDYYLVKARASGTNAFGGVVSSWYIIEVIIDDNGKKYSRDNIQSFDSEPTASQISICKSYFGW